MISKTPITRIFWNVSLIYFFTEGQYLKTKVKDLSLSVSFKLTENVFIVPTIYILMSLSFRREEIVKRNSHSLQRVADTSIYCTCYHKIKRLC